MYSGGEACMMPRIFFKQAVSIGDMVTIDGANGHHFVRVLRAGPGEQLVLAAKNGPYLATIRQIDSKFAALAVSVESRCASHEPEYPLVVVQGLAKGDKMDMIIQKCTEVGTSHIVCYQAKRSVVSLRGKVEQKVDRWQRIALEAASQAQRDVIPTVRYADSVQTLCTILTEFGASQVLMLDEAEKEVSLKSTLQSFPKVKGQSIVLAIGPEGGWDDEERDEIHQSLNGISVTLGPRILRTETVGVVASAVVLYHFGQFGV